MKNLTKNPKMVKERRYNRKQVSKLNYMLSQAAARDGTRITTTTQGQETASGTLPIY